MLVSRRVDAHDLFAHLQAVVVDEVHAFAGDDRGWHLLAVLERLTRLAGRPLQRIGLSATVGNPEELLGWLQGAEAKERTGKVLAPSASVETPTEVTLDYVGNVANAAKVIATLHRGEKRLVFCDSRKRVEELASALRAHDVETYLSHSSLSAEERRRSEQAFAEARDCVIVATSTLELGIDVGDLDRIIQLDAPGTVAAFQQRLGRTGRRPGTTRNCLLLATSEEGLLQAAGLLQLWQQGWLEPVTAPPNPWHIVAQQVLALVLQEGQVGDRTWREWWNGLELLDDTADEIVHHLVACGYLEADGRMLFMGQQAERTFGRRNFLELTSVFSADPEFLALQGRREIGQVHPLALTTPTEGPRVVLLGGASWRVVSVDWRRRHCFVEPTDLPGRIQWRGSPRPLHFHLCRAMRDVIAGDTPEVKLSARAREQLAGVRERFGETVDPQHTVVRRDDDDLRWWTWAGAAANRTLEAALGDVVEASARANNLWIRLRPDVTLGDIQQATRRARGNTLPAPEVTEEATRGLKFADALPPTIAAGVLGMRLSDAYGARRLLGEDLLIDR